MFNFLMVSGGESGRPVGAAAAAAAGKQEEKVEGGETVCVCFSRLEVIDLEGLPHGNLQPGATGVFVCVFPCVCAGAPCTPSWHERSPTSRFPLPSDARTETTLAFLKPDV